MMLVLSAILLAILIYSSNTFGAVISGKQKRALRAIAGRLKQTKTLDEIQVKNAVHHIHIPHTRAWDDMDTARREEKLSDPYSISCISCFSFTPVHRTVFDNPKYLLGKCSTTCCVVWEHEQHKKYSRSERDGFASIECCKEARSFDIW